MQPRRARFTTTPDTPPPLLDCPHCQRPLVYRQTVYNGVNPLERWDHFDCRRCGPFEYRQRTRVIKSLGRWSSAPGTRAASHQDDDDDEPR